MLHATAASPCPSLSGGDVEPHPLTSPPASRRWGTRRPRLRAAEPDAVAGREAGACTQTCVSRNDRDDDLGSRLAIADAGWAGDVRLGLERAAAGAGGEARTGREELAAPAGARLVGRALARGAARLAARVGGDGPAGGGGDAAEEEDAGVGAGAALEGEVTELAGRALRVRAAARRVVAAGRAADSADGQVALHAAGEGEAGEGDREEGCAAHGGRSVQRASGAMTTSTGPGLSFPSGLGAGKGWVVAGVPPAQARRPASTGLGQDVTARAARPAGRSTAHPARPRPGSSAPCSGRSPRAGRRTTPPATGAGRRPRARARSPPPGRAPAAHRPAGVARAADAGAWAAR